MANLNDQRVKCIQNELNFDSKSIKAFRLMSSNTHEQFIFTSHQNWLNGYDIINDQVESTFVPEYNNSIVFAFYAQKRNEIFVVEWDLKNT
jgi:hypothetical protein